MVAAIVGLLRSFKERASLACQPVAILGTTSAPHATAIGLHPTVVTDTCVFVVVGFVIALAAAAAAATLMSVGYMFHLGYDIFPATFRRRAFAITERATRQRGFRVSVIYAFREHHVTPGREFLGLKAFIMGDNDALNSFSSGPVRGSLQHLDFGVVLEREVAVNHDLYVPGIHRLLHSFQFLHYLINSRKELPCAFSQLHLYSVEFNGESAWLLGPAGALVLHEP